MAEEICRITDMWHESCAERDVLAEVVAALKTDGDGLRARLSTCAHRTVHLEHDLAETAAELERVTAERDAARDLAIRLEGMLGRIEELHAGGHWCVPLRAGEAWSWSSGEKTDPCLTRRLAHGTDQ